MMAAILDPEPKVQVDLPLIAQADSPVGLDLGPMQSGQEHRGQNGDGGDDHQQLDQREAYPPLGHGNLQAEQGCRSQSSESSKPFTLPVPSSNLAVHTRSRSSLCARVAG